MRMSCEIDAIHSANNLTQPKIALNIVTAVSQSAYSTGGMRALLIVVSHIYEQFC